MGGTSSKPEKTGIENTSLSNKLKETCKDHPVVVTASTAGTVYGTLGGTGAATGSNLLPPVAAQIASAIGGLGVISSLPFGGVFIIALASGGFAAVSYGGVAKGVDLGVSAYYRRENEVLKETIIKSTRSVSEKHKILMEEAKKHNLVCSITGEIFLNPVKIRKSGKVYERTAILGHKVKCEEQGVGLFCPLSGIKLEGSDFDNLEIDKETKFKLEIFPYAAALYQKRFIEPENRMTKSSVDQWNDALENHRKKYFSPSSA